MTKDTVIVFVFIITMIWMGITIFAKSPAKVDIAQAKSLYDSGFQAGSHAAAEALPPCKEKGK